VILHWTLGRSESRWTQGVHTEREREGLVQSRDIVVFIFIFIWSSVTVLVPCSLSQGFSATVSWDQRSDSFTIILATGPYGPTDRPDRHQQQLTMSGCLSHLLFRRPLREPRSAGAKHVMREFEHDMLRSFDTTTYTHTRDRRFRCHDVQVLIDECEYDVGYQLKGAIAATRTVPPQANHVLLFADGSSQYVRTTRHGTHTHSLSLYLLQSHICKGPGELRAVTVQHCSRKLVTVLGPTRTLPGKATGARKC